jgi:hypothetical protein
MNNLVKLFFQEVEVVKSSDYFLKDNFYLLVFLFIDFEDIITSFWLVMNLGFLEVVSFETFIQEVDVLADLLLQDGVKFVLDKLVELLCEGGLILLSEEFDSFEQELKRLIQ